MDRYAVGPLASCLFSHAAEFSFLPRTRNTMKPFLLRSLGWMIVLLAAVAPAAPAAAQENWPDFRGPQADGTCQYGIPLRWSETQNVVWKTPLPGRGWSTPVIWGRWLWMTTATDEGRKQWALQVDKQTGRLVRQVLVFENPQPEPINPLNSYASPSPVIEPGRVYVHFGTYGTACLDSETGRILWTRRDLKLDHKEGPGSSPVLWRDLLIFHCDGMDVQYIVALDKRTGRTVWKTPRSVDLEPFRPDFRKAYSTPLVVQTDWGPVLVSTAAQAAYGYDPRTGQELWRLRYRGFSNVSRPVLRRGLLLLNTGYSRAQLWALPLAPYRGEVPPDRVRWRVLRNVPRRASVVATEELVFMVDDRGVATCLELETGKRVWTKRLGGNYSASALLSGKRVYFFNQEGTTTVVQAARTFRQLARNHLKDGLMASPAVSQGALYLRTRETLYRIEARSPNRGG